MMLILYTSLHYKYNIELSLHVRLNDTGRIQVVKLLQTSCPTKEYLCSSMTDYTGTASKPAAYYWMFHRPHSSGRVTWALHPTMQG